MPAEELFLWQAFDRISPISDVRGDVLAAVTAASVFQAQGAQVSAADLLPKWGEVVEAVEEVEDYDPEATFMAWLQGRAAITAAQEVTDAAANAGL